MFDVPRFAAEHGYQAVIVENVLQIHDWIFIAEWWSMMRRLGYRWQVCSFNSMFFGQPGGVGPPQSRDRAYIVFTREHNPLPDLEFRPRAWCPRCDADIDARQVWKNGRTHGRYRQQYIYCCPACGTEALPYVVPAAAAIDWSLPAEPIGGRKRPLTKSTIARIRAYFTRHGWDPAVVPTTHTSRKGQLEVTGQLPRSVAEPARAQTAQPEQGLLLPFVDTARRNATGRPVDWPLTTVAAEGNHHALVFPERGYVVANFTPGWLRDAGRLPLGAVTTKDHHSLLVPSGGSWNTTARPVGLPMRTLTGTETNGLVRLPADFLIPYYTKGGNGRSVAEPVGTMTVEDCWAIASPPASPPAAGKNLDEFIEACRFRMLVPAEISAAMAFPGGYEVTGNRDEQVAQYGNAVTPPVMT